MITGGKQQSYRARPCGKKRKQTNTGLEETESDTPNLRLGTHRLAPTRMCRSSEVQALRAR